MKRKMIAIVATALCAVLAVPALAFGVGNLSAGQAIVASDAPAQTVAWRGYVDADGDGVCDNRGTGNGIGNGAGAHHGYGSSSAADRPGYVDADGDGVCDSYAGQGQGRGQGQGGGHHGGHGTCNR